MNAGISYSNEQLFLNVSSLWSTVTFDDFERYCLTFFKCFEAFVLNSGEVYEYIVLTFYFDEAITFFCVEPFHVTL